MAAPIGDLLEKALWKSKSPRRVNISVWIMIFGNLNCALVMQMKLPSHCLSPHICPLCMAEKDLQHLFFDCTYALRCWHRLFSFFNLCWVFGNRCSENVLQILVGPSLKKSPKTLWYNAVKALLVEIWFERNQRVFYDKATPRLERCEIARLNASTWCTQSRSFSDFSIMDIVVNRRAFIFSAL